jgi:Fe-S-cluster-containing hydrogenase component 2
MPDPTPAPLAPDARPTGRDEESPFARDAFDVLIRREEETRDRFKQRVTLTIDGYPVTVPRAVPKTDALGNRVRGPDGDYVFRTTTIHDAAVELVTPGTWAADGAGPAAGKAAWTEEDLKERIPTLCHQRHVAPVGVCRVCSVHVTKADQRRAPRKLFPACHHWVEDGMIVTTRLGAAGFNPDAPPEADRKGAARAAAEVNTAVRLLTEFLVADHHRPARGAKRYDDELGAAAAVLEVGTGEVRPRLARGADVPGRNEGKAPADRRLPLPVIAPPEEAGASRVWEEWNDVVDAAYPYSSGTVVVDHDRCILCDRCARACSQVKPFKVIGHTGKGYKTRVSFDLDQLMGESSCVQCGECMVSCPTGALSLRRRVQPRAWDDSPDKIPINPNAPFKAGSGFLTADEMREVRLRYCPDPDKPDEARVVFPFRAIPYAYLKWNEGAVRRWEVPPGHEMELCWAGEYGTTAFLLQGTGAFEVYRGGTAPPPDRRAAGPRRRATQPREEYGEFAAVVTGDELVVGEMACLTQRPRGATVLAVAEADNPSIAFGADENGWPTAVLDGRTPGPVVVYEVTRNMLDMMRRSADVRDDVREVYTRRAVDACVSRGRLFQGLTRRSDRDAAVMFLLKEGVRRGVEIRRVDPGDLVVEEGKLASDFYLIRFGTVRVFNTAGRREQVSALLSDGDYFGELALLGGREVTRTASVAALDPVEVVRVPGPVFRDLVARFPALKDALRAKKAPDPAWDDAPPRVRAEYVRQGLYQAQKMLVLDLKSCTRCDECTKACADSHGRDARLLRDGNRFGDFLVATSCRSCHTPYCMEGCPVDAIHRKGTHLEVVIDDHCIGCGLCEKQCPYGAIHMVRRPDPNPAAAGAPGGDPHRTARVARNCDLCGGDTPLCVRACPHDAAFRLPGRAVLEEVVTRLS